MDPAGVLAQQQQNVEIKHELNTTKQGEFSKPEPKKGKQKSKDNSHSLLHVKF